MRSSRVIATFGVLLAASSTTGCLQDLIVKRYVATIRSTEGSIETLHDFDVARQVSESSIGQLEAFYRLSPADPEVRYMLTRAWTTLGLRFMLDEAERHRTHGDMARATYERRRLRAALARARFYAGLWLEDQSDGYQPEAPAGARALTWVDDDLDDEDDASMLVFAGAAWLVHAWANHSPPSSDLDLGRALLARAIALNPKVENGLAQVLLALDAAREAPERAAVLAQEAIAATDGRYLPARLAVALVEACRATGAQATGDGLQSIVDAGDPLPRARLDTIVAQRHARRYLAHPESLPLCPLKVGVEP
jgi:hypothetical protein